MAGGASDRLDDVIDMWPTYELNLKPPASAPGCRVGNTSSRLLGRYVLNELSKPLAISKWIAALSAGRPG